MTNELALPGAGSFPPRNVTYLEFEKPLEKIEQEMALLQFERLDAGRDPSAGLKRLQTRLISRTKRLYSHLTAWETVLVARHPQRPQITDYIRNIVQDFCELHGDRSFRDDEAMVTGFGRMGGHKIMLVGHNKGKDTPERLKCNFGCAHPEGYRKALLKMRLAEKYKLPVVCLIDTQGAYPGIGSEERGVAQSIAVNMLEMSRLRVPIVCVVIGEGGSGGALGIGVGDRVAMFEHAFYSVISAEGCSAILWKTDAQRERAAECLKFTAEDLKKLGIIDYVIPEPLGGAHRRPEEAYQSLEKYLIETLRELRRSKIETILMRRYQRFRHLGSFFESPAQATKAAAAKAAPRPRSRLGGRRSVAAAGPVSPA